MRGLLSYRKTTLILAGLLVVAVLAWVFVRAPKGTSPGAIFGDVERMGQARQLIVEMVRAVRQAAALKPGTPREDVLARRARIEWVLAVNDHLSEELKAADSRWIPVDEAIDLLSECRKLGQLSLEKMPTGKPINKAPSSETIEYDPDLEGITADVSGLLETSAEQLLSAEERLERRVQQAVIGGMSARGSVLGMEAADLLLATTILGCLFGMGILVHAGRRLGVPPEKLQHLEIELIGKADRKAAMNLCHRRVKELLELANNFCRG